MAVTLLQPQLIKGFELSSSRVMINKARETDIKPMKKHSGNGVVNDEIDH